MLSARGERTTYTLGVHQSRTRGALPETFTTLSHVLMTFAHARTQQIRTVLLQVRVGFLFLYNSRFTNIIFPLH